MTKLGKQPAELKKRVLSPKQLQQSNFKLGNQGENQAVAFLQHKKYRILDQNIRWKNAEIDVIALDTVRQEIVFVEVKTRKSTVFGHPSQAVNDKKLRSLKKVAYMWLKKSNLAKDFRFDIISVLPGKIEHFENITWP